MKSFKEMMEDVLEEGKKDSAYVNSVLKNPGTLKGTKEIFINGVGLFRWNSVHKTYNSIKGNDILTKKQAERINWDKS